MLGQGAQRVSRALPWKGGAGEAGGRKVGGRGVRGATRLAEEPGRPLEESTAFLAMSVEHHLLPLQHLT